ncbi:MAG: hypothetical protein JETT_0526 [Candidatus Jettenia ecosi]|uniref:Uncharacterized protein n=1 Tax=Candidatus Jettenia ecosi TaxID=2494326 RepID=A0A533QJZ6_9BACT|nr:MAG: hypothetical protein JETT_0526 [Candidatus Jettenia ecosi]
MPLHSYSDQRLKPNRKRYHDYGIRYRSFSIPKGWYDYGNNRKKGFQPRRGDMRNLRSGVIPSGFDFMVISYL